MNRRLLGLGMAMCLCQIGGCAGTTVDPVRGNEAELKGIRYYEPAPFLLVYSDARGNIKSQIIYLPDLMNMRSIDPFAVLAINNSVLTFSNGMLTQGKVQVDESVIPKQVFDSVKAIAGTIAGAAFDIPSEQATTIPAPKLYRIHIDPKGVVKLIGGESDPEVIEVKYTSKDEIKDGAK